MTTRDPRSRDPRPPESGHGRDPTQSLSLDEAMSDPDAHPSLALGTHDLHHSKHTSVEGPARRRTPTARPAPPPIPRSPTAEEDERVGSTLGSYRLGELLDRWLEVKRTSVEPRTIASYEWVAAKYLRPRLGDRELAGLRTMDLAAVHAELHRVGTLGSDGAGLPHRGAQPDGVVERGWQSSAGTQGGTGAPCRQLGICRSILVQSLAWTARGYRRRSHR